MKLPQLHKKQSRGPCYRIPKNFGLVLIRDKYEQGIERSLMTQIKGILKN